MGGPKKHIGVTISKETHERLKAYIKIKTPKYGTLTLSGVVADMIEHCLDAEGFYDPWKCGDPNGEFV